MKLSSKPTWLDDKLIIKKTYDATPTLDSLRQIKDAGLGLNGEMRHVGRIPGALISKWLNEAGVSWEDTAARDEIVNRKLMSGEYSAFRNWEGNF